MGVTEKDTNSQDKQQLGTSFCAYLTLLWLVHMCKIRLVSGCVQVATHLIWE